MAEIMTNFRAVDMLGTAKPKPVAKTKAPKVQAPKVVEPVVIEEPVVVVDEVEVVEESAPTAE